MTDEEEPKEEPVQNKRPVQNENHFIRGLVIGLGIALLVIVCFSFGMMVGEMKTRFSYRWGENYHEFFGGPRIQPGQPRGFFGGHGTAGEIVKKKAKSIIIKGPDNAEKVILLSNQTSIVKGRDEATLKDIRVGNQAVVVGSPNKKGQIEARLIRIFEVQSWKGSLWERKDTPSSPSSLL
jgi:hypothetical protein